MTQMEAISKQKRRGGVPNNLIRPCLLPKNLVQLTEIHPEKRDSHKPSPCDCNNTTQAWGLDCVKTLFTSHKELLYSPHSMAITPTRAPIHQIVTDKQHIIPSNNLTKTLGTLPETLRRFTSRVSSTDAATRPSSQRATTSTSTPPLQRS